VSIGEAGRPITIRHQAAAGALTPGTVRPSHLQITHDLAVTRNDHGVGSLLVTKQDLAHASLQAAASVQVYHLGGSPRFSRVDRGRDAQSNAEPRNAGLPGRLVDPQSTPNVHIAVMGMVEE
jgi:hypothetical protein